MTSSTEVAPGVVVDGTSTLARTNRLTSVDMLRGLVLVIMAVDHVRDMVTHPASTDYSPRWSSPALPGRGSSRAGSRTSALRRSSCSRG